MKTVMLVPFVLGDLRMALYLKVVTRVLQSVSVSPLPNAPSIVAGIVDIHGSLVPAINLRKRFRLPNRAIEPTDYMVIAEMTPIDPSRRVNRTVALLADSVGSVVEVKQEDVVPAGSIVPGLRHVAGVAQLPNGLLLIHDLDQCLSLPESRALDMALESMRDA